MTPMVPIALLGWIPVVVVLFALLPPLRAVIAAYLVAWLFLPIYTYQLAGLPDYDKMTATSLGVCLGTVIFDVKRFTTLRPKWIDLGMAVWCLSMAASSLSNGLGLYNGLSLSFEAVVTWGFPYLIGRIYFTNVKALKELAVGIVIGACIYVPLCWYEIRMSPQLHRMVYGYHQHAFYQTRRLVGWRPMVFMTHGLMLGMWMTTATLTSFWLWITGAVKRLYQIPMAVVTGVLFVTAVACQSSGALGLLFLGLAAAVSIKWLRTSLVVVLLLVAPCIYIAVRAPGSWSGDQLLTFSQKVFGPTRTASLETRMRNENTLAEKARERPLLGWDGWGRFRVIDETGRDRSITDGLWIITFGSKGLVGVFALLFIVLVPVLRTWKKIPVRLWAHPVAAPVGVLALVLPLHMIDNLLNAMFNPFYMLIAGGLSGLAGVQVRPRVAAPAPALLPPDLLPARPPRVVLPARRPMLPLPHKR